MIRRRAEPEWRWARAISPGITFWMLATMVLLADRPGSSGLVSLSTRRSACSVPTSCAARIAWLRKSAPVPHPRHGLALGLAGDTAADPGGRDVLGSELRVVVLQFGFRRLDVRELHRQSSPAPPVAGIAPPGVVQRA